MAVQIANGAAINFGTFGAAATVTHIRFRRGSDDGQPVVKALATAKAVGNGEEFEIPEGGLTVRYPSGDVTDAHMRALVEGYWGTGGSLSVEIDAMTNATTPVAVTGYSQQTTNDWDVTTPAD